MDANILKLKLISRTRYTKELLVKVSKTTDLDKIRGLSRRIKINLKGDHVCRVHGPRSYYVKCLKELCLETRENE
jgi:hypothetical protein